MKFVKTNQLVALGHPLAQFIQGIDGALQVAQLTVDLAHELMKMQPGLAPYLHRIEKAVHQEALAPADAAIHVDAAGNLRMADQFLEGIRTLGLIGRPLLGAAIERCHRPQLGGVALVAPGPQLGLIGGKDRHRG